MGFFTLLYKKLKDMIVRYESTVDEEKILIISEIDKYLGEIDVEDFLECIDDSKDTFIEDEYTYYTVDKVKLNKYLK